MARIIFSQIQQAPWPRLQEGRKIPVLDNDLADCESDLHSVDCLFVKFSGCLMSQ